MNKLFGGLVCSALAFSAVAENLQTDEEVTLRVKPSLHVGLTFGGDELGTLSYEDGSDSTISAGSLLALGGGLAFDFHPNFELQSNISYHWDSADAKNGDISFSRFNIEAIPYYKPNEQWRLGLGLAMHASPSLEANFYGTSKLEFDSAIGAIISAGYKLSGSDSWIDFRYVNIEYSPTNIDGMAVTSGETFDGSHVGAYFHWVF